MKISRRAMMKAMCGGTLWLAVGSWAAAAEPGPVKARFRLIFSKYIGDPRGDPAKMAFEIHTVDIRHDAKFLKLGELFFTTPFKLSKFEYKERPDEPLLSQKDASELTLVHKDTGQKVVLVLRKVTNVADLLQPPPKAPK